MIRQKKKLEGEIIRENETEYKVGQYVRELNDKNIFDDKMKSKYSNEIYEITKVNNNSLIIKNDKNDLFKIKKDEVKIVTKPTENNIKLKEKIIKDMKEKPWTNKVGHIYAYGEFLPPEFSPYGYAETMASDYNPLQKTETEKGGYNFYEIKKKDYSPTLDNKMLPNTFLEIQGSIEKEIIQCSTCDRAYNIHYIEMELLRKMNQSLPH